VLIEVRLQLRFRKLLTFRGIESKSMLEGVFGLEVSVRVDIRSTEFDFDGGVLDLAVIRQL